MSLSCEIIKKYGDFSLEVSLNCDSKRIGILGASGCGKTLTLKSIAGLVRPDAGYINLDGRVLFDSEKKTDIKPGKRHIGYLFQNYALFPNMTVEENILAGLHAVGKDTGKQGKEAVSKIMESFDLTDLSGHLPRELSGGQQQRTALARMLACDPELLLFDEPFSAMDSFMREALRLELIRTLDRYDKTVILVSHDRDEIYQMCDWLLLMEEGRVIAQGPVKDLFAHPKTSAAARLTGCKNISRIERIGERRFRALDWHGLELETGEKIGDEIRYAGIRAHDFSADDPGTNVIETGSAKISNLPFEWYVIMENGLWWKIPKSLNDPEIGDKIPPRVSIAPEKILLME